ncbi:alpha-soluble NSF attachment protein [Diutina catenulata]
MADPKVLIEEGEALLKPKSGFMSFFSGESNSSRMDDASECFTQAGNAYRLQKDFSNAGNQFIRAADIQTKLNNHNDAANNYVEAYKCFKGVSPSDGIDALKRAIHIFLTQNGQFRRAANFTSDLAELYESVGDTEQAAVAYEQAGDYFSTDHADNLASKQFLKCADVLAGAGNYGKAVEMYDKVIEVAMGNNLSRWSLKDYFFKVVICLLCEGDDVEAQKRMEKYVAEEPSFEQSREYKLLVDILDAIEQGDAATFADKVFEYDQFSKLDKLKTQLLLKVKSSVVEKEEEDLL